MQSCSPPYRSTYTLRHRRTSPRPRHSTPHRAAPRAPTLSSPNHRVCGAAHVLRSVLLPKQSRPVPSYRERLLHSLVSALSACALSARGSLGARLHRAGLLARLLGRRLLALLDALTASSARATRAKGEGSERSREVACSVALPRRAAVKAWRAPFPTSMAALTMQRPCRRCAGRGPCC